MATPPMVQGSGFGADQLMGVLEEHDLALRV